MKRAAKFESVDDLLPWLVEQSAEDLRRWLVEALAENSDLCQRLCRTARKSRGLSPDWDLLRSQIAKAMGPPVRSYVDWRGASAWCSAMERASVDPLEELLDAGHAAGIVELTEVEARTTARLARDRVQRLIDQFGAAKPD